MSVHKEIAKHSEKQHERIKMFHQLEEMRERYIDEAVENCMNKQPFSVEKINNVTKKINDLAREGIVPTRKLVTTEMVEAYATKLQKKK